MRTFKILYFYADGTMEEQTFMFKRDRDAVAQRKVYRNPAKVELVLKRLFASL